MAFPNSITLNDGTGTSPTGDHIYDTSGYGTGFRTLSEGAANLETPAGLRIAHTSEKRGGNKVRRSLTEVSVVVEDATTGTPATIRAMLILELPTEIATKAQATGVVKQLLHLYSQTSGANIAQLVNGSL